MDNPRARAAGTNTPDHYPVLNLGRAVLGFVARHTLRSLLLLGLLGIGMVAQSCTLLKPTLAPTNLKTDHPPKIYEAKVRKKASLRLRNGTESIDIKVTGDSILLQIIAPENARIKVKGRKRLKRQHPTTPEGKKE